MPSVGFASLAAIATSLALGTSFKDAPSLRPITVTLAAANPCLNPSVKVGLDCLHRHSEPKGLKKVLAPQTVPSEVALGGTQPPHEQAQKDSPHVDFSIDFVTGSAGLAPSAQHLLGTLADILMDPSLRGNRFLIEGHTDTVGTDAENQTLSEQRARAVLDYLTHKLRVPRDAVQAVGVGKTHLIFETADQTPEARNRVVRITLLE